MDRARTFEWRSDWKFDNLVNVGNSTVLNPTFKFDRLSNDTNHSSFDRMNGLCQVPIRLVLKETALSSVKDHTTVYNDFDFCGVVSILLFRKPFSLEKSCAQKEDSKGQLNLKRQPRRKEGDSLRRG